MELYSLQFAIFLGSSLVATYALRRLAPRWQWVALLASSLVFYCLEGGGSTLLYLVGCALVTWAAPLGFQRLDERCRCLRSQAADRAQRKAVKVRFARAKRLVLVLALLACFGVLAYLKYWNALLYQVGAATSPTSLGLLLPLGISFYTFQSVSYLIDAYQGNFEPQRNFAKHLLFVSWFPQILQGPINRYDELAPQLLDPQTPAADQVDRSILLFGYGLIKKYAIANLTVSVIAKIFSHVTPAIPGSAVVFGILLYSAQQYGDFSGGIDMVEAVSELYGIRMAPNFRRPYLSVSLADFWRRWHISLGRWMRDYVFFPLALTRPMRTLGKWGEAHLGRHVGRTLPACIANIVVFVIVGVWHGPQAHYLAWGLYNGIVIAMADLLRPATDALAHALRVRRESGGYHAFQVVRTFLVVNLGWYFDRIYDFGDSLLCLRNTFMHFKPQALVPFLDAAGLTSAGVWGLWIAGVACAFVLVVSLYEEAGHDVRAAVLSSNVVTRWFLYTAVCLMLAMAMALGSGGGFMYANF